MAVNPVNRKDIRSGLVTIFETELVGTGLPVEAVYSYNVRSFQGQSPVVVVRSAGIRRKPLGQASSVYRNWIPMGILIYVKDETGSWTAEDAADALDDCEAAIVKAVLENRKNPGVWNDMIPEDSYSQIFNVTVDGEPYLLEIMTVLVIAND